MAACDDGFVGAGAEFSRTAQGIWGDARGNISSVSLELHAIALPGDAAVSELRTIGFNITNFGITENSHGAPFQIASMARLG